MSQSASLALTLPNSTHAGTHSHSEPIDLNATYRFAFARQRWFSGLTALAQGGLMAGVGIFLLTQIPATPNLTIQMAILGTLLSLGGALVAARTWSDFFGSITVNADGLRMSHGLASFQLEWPNVTRWRITESAAKTSDLAAADVWTITSEFPHRIPGARLDLHDLRKLRHLLHAFAPGHEHN